MTSKRIRTGVLSVVAFALAIALLSSKTLPVAAAGDHLDDTFDGNGKLATDFAGENDVANDVAIQADGKIVVVGKSGNDVALARYNADGSLDTTFSGDGRVTGLAGEAYAVAIQPDGKILIAGSVGVDFSIRFLVARYTTNGNLDNSFNGNGSNIVAFQGVGISVAAAFCLAIQPDGYIVLAGFKTDSDTITTFRSWAIARFAPSGLLDPLFDSDGRVTTNFGSAGATQEHASAITVMSDGKILVAGTSSPSSNSNFSLARYNTNGSLDTSFDADGKVSIDFGANEKLNDMKLQADGKIVGAGTSGAGTVEHFAVARFNSNGTADTSFDLDGIALTNINPTGADIAQEMIIQGDGKIVLAGTKVNPDSAPDDYALARYLQNGSLDTGFGQGGVLITDLNNNSDDAANAIALQTDGKFVLAGKTRNTGTTHDNFAAARYLPSSTTQYDFDYDGRADLSIFRPAVGEWWYLRSSNGSNAAFQFGTTTDKITPADFTGDGKTDIAFFRPSTGFWFILRSEDNSFYSFPFGMAGDIPAPADFDGDKKSDPALFRPSNSTWYISKSSGGTTIQQFGANGDNPVPADYDGDAKADIAIYRPSNGQWWQNRSTGGTLAMTFGTSTDKPVQADYTGDGKTDVAFWRPASGSWFILRSENSSFYSFPFGANGDVPAPGDYDGDGRSDATVFRPTNSTWYSQRSTAGTLIQQFGANNDRPVPNAFVP